MKCNASQIIEVSDGEDENLALTYPKNEWSGLRWTLTARGWLCPYPHRDDPRLRG